MSALIIPFPAKLAAKRKKLTGSRLALIAVDQMRRYRILGDGTMSDMSAAQGELIQLIRAYASSGEPPKLCELEVILGQYAGALRHMYFADQFLTEHGQAIT